MHQHNLKQLGLAVLNYESSNQTLPIGASLEEGAMWTVFILPYMEEQSLRDIVHIDNVRKYQWASPRQYSYPVTDPTFRNIIAVETPVPILRCPSGGLPEHQYDRTRDNWIVQRRAPGSYLACASGVVTNQNVPAGMRETDGVMYGQHWRNSGSSVELRMIADGLSKTLLIGEAQHDVNAQIDIGKTQEAAEGDHKDHWYFGK